MHNILLLHLREQHRLTPKQIEERAGIPAARYLEYRNTPGLILATGIERLSVLHKVKPEYLRDYSHQLELFACHNRIMVKGRTHGATHPGAEAKEQAESIGIWPGETRKQ